MSDYDRSEMERDVRLLDRGGVEYGSNLGIGIDPRQLPDRCAKWAVLEADYTYSRTSQSWSYGSSTIETNLDLEQTSSYDLESILGQTGGEEPDDIVGSNAIARLADQIGAMPMLVSDEGLAPPVPAPADQTAPPPGDRIAESRFTSRNVFIGIGIALIAVGVVWVTVAAVRNRRGTSS
jgi:hypothetical protein